MPEWMMEKETNGTFENDVCRVLDGKIGEVEERRMGQIQRLRTELWGQTDAKKRNELYADLRTLWEELDCLKGIA